MRALLVYPEFPVTYWGFQHSMRLAGKRAALPPLGLLSFAALLPESWEIELVDLNVQPLADEDIEAADAVFVGGMHIQHPSMREVLGRARRVGRRTVVGGPGPTTASDADYAMADVVFKGEAEGRIDEILDALETGGRHAIEKSASFPDLTEVPLPRYDLIEIDRYASVSLQYSRGCPFQCEFCDIIEIFGRVPRVKSAEQLLAELDLLYCSGHRGTVFFVDDNFIGNAAAVLEMLPELIAWQKDRRYPFRLYTEASLNLGNDEALVDGMVEAGFTSVFLGIETPDPVSLREAKKTQNLRVDPEEAVEKLTKAGLEVMAGFIVGFDNDDESAFELQRRFIQRSPIPQAMVGILSALPGTGLWRRLESEGRLRSSASGDQFDRPNFEPKMGESALLSGYRELMRDIYSTDGYYDRCEAVLELAPRVAHRRRPVPADVRILLRTVVAIGLFSSRRWRFWRLLLRTLLRAPHAFAWAIACAVKGEHLIRYTEEYVVPRINRAQSAVRLGEAAHSPSTERGVDVSWKRSPAA